MVKQTLHEISKETARRVGEKDNLDKYINHLLKIYENKLNEEERKLVLKVILESLYYKAALEDPKRIANIFASRTRNFVIGTLWVSLCIIVITAFLGLSPVVNKLTEVVIKLGEIL